MDRGAASVGLQERASPQEKLVAREGNDRLADVFRQKHQDGAVAAQSGVLGYEDGNAQFKRLVRNGKCREDGNEPAVRT